MKKFLSLAVLVSFLVVGHLASGCVGKTIFLGIATPSDKLLAEMASLMITERTGTSVKIQVYKDVKELYSAIKQGKVNIIIETPDRAMAVLGRPKDAANVSRFDFVKSEYRKSLDMTWLEPLGGAQQHAPVLTTETLATYPALPKLLNKLAGVLTNDAYIKLLKSADSDDKTRKVAREFLKGKKLI